VTVLDAPPDPRLPGVAELGHRIAEASAAVGARVTWDWPAVPAQRGRIARGRTTAGGAGRLLPTADGWAAVQLARDDDHDLLDAWFALAGVEPRTGVAVDPTDPWPAVARGVRRATGAALADAAGLVGLAVGVLDECRPDGHGGVHVALGRHRRTRRPPRVVDLSALWAGPLCGAVLAAAGAEVTKVEAIDRPDGARVGDPDLFAALNGHKAHRTLDLRTAAGRADLAALVRDADVVVEASRPRALAALGLVAEHLVTGDDGPAVWVSITGHGRRSPRIAYGDDAAVAGGLVDHDHDGPRFRGDALADPLSGLAAAATALELLADGDGGLVEVSMAAVAAAHASHDRTP
jgi:hypothetical protein